MIYTTTRRSAGDNYHAGRNGHAIEGIAIHVTEGDRGSVRSWFANDGSDVSATYMVCTDGSRDQFVEEDDTAFHAGRVQRPTAKIVLDRPGVNPNLYLIGIEHEGSGKSDLTPKQRDSSLELMADIIARRPLVKPTRYHIIGHHEVYAPKACPGAINVDALVAALSPSRLTRPVVVWSNAVGDWLVVTHVVTDREWYYLPMSAVRRGTVQRASTPLSAMPLVAP